MIKVDLITGFLGSGKTTFIKQYAKYLMKKGNKIAILENDYGAVNIDMMLLQDLQGEFCDIETVAGGCDKDCHRRRFKTKLIALGMCGYDRVIVEPSGIFDVDEFFDVLYESPLDRWYEKGSVIAIVNSALDNELSEQSEYFLASQTVCAGKIILSCTQEVSENKINSVINHLNYSANKIGCGQFSDDRFIIKNWVDFTDEDFLSAASCGSVNAEHTKLQTNSDEVYSTLYYMNLDISENELIEASKSLMNDSKYGNIFRIKGFIMTQNGWVELNASKNSLKTKPVDKGQNVLIIIGEKLNKDIIDNYFYLNKNL